MDGLNIYSIYTNNQNSTGKTRLQTEVIVQSREWGTAAMPEFPDLNYLILPQCLFYDLNGSGNMVLRAGLPGEPRCAKPFDFADLNAIYVSILFNSTNYTDGTLTCDGEFNSGGLCASDAFNPTSPEPYIGAFLIERCPASGCRVLSTAMGPYAYKTVSAHFDPAANEYGKIEIQATADYEIEIKLGRMDDADNFPVYVKNEYIDEPFEADLNVFFDQKIQLFYFTGFLITASKENIPIVRST